MPTKKKTDQSAKVKELEAQLQQAQEAVKRSQADYQNLVRRSREEKIAFMQRANHELVESILEPLGNLERAAAQLNDAGLDMVVNQFKTTLEQQGLAEISPLNQPFDPATMEAVEAEESDDQAATETQTPVVTEVRAKGYTLHNQVIRHAKVVVSSKNK